MSISHLDTTVHEEILQRALAWSGLRRAEKLSNLLLLLHKNSGKPALTEKEIAAELFPRPPRGDAGDDSVVRVSIRQLRFKLQEYFASAGAQEPWMVEIPKGEYTLRFVERPREPEPLLPEELPAARRPMWLWAACGLLLLAAAFAGYIAGRSTSSASPIPDTLLTRAMGSGRYSLTIVPGDALGRTLSTLAAEEPSLNQYLAGPAEPPADLLAGERAARLFTGLAGMRAMTGAHAATAAQMVASLGSLGTRVALRHPRDVHVRDLRQNSFAFLAARYANPIVDLFEPRLTLRCDNQSPRRLIGVVDTLAKGDQPKRYSTTDDVSFARIAFLPNLGADGGRVLLLSGLGAVGTEAAALVAADPAWLKALTARLPANEPFFEALLEAKSANNLPVDLRLLLVRPVATR